MRAMDQKAKTEQGRGGGSSEGRRCGVWVHLIEKVLLGQDKEEVRTSQASHSTPALSGLCENPSVVFPLGTSPMGPPFHSNLNPSCWDSLLLFLCDMTGILFPDVFTPHSGTTSLHCPRKFPGAELSQLYGNREFREQSSRGEFPLPWSFMGMTSLSSISRGCQGV